MKTHITLHLACAALIVCIAGCSGSATGPADKGEEGGHKHHHGAETGPHKGVLIGLGNEEAHVELVHDDETHVFTVYVLDGEAKENVPIEQKEFALSLIDGEKKLDFKLPAKPLMGEPTGKSSRFELTDDALVTLIDKKGVICDFKVQVGGKMHSGTYTSTGEEHEHAAEKIGK